MQFAYSKRLFAACEYWWNSLICDVPITSSKGLTMRKYGLISQINLELPDSWQLKTFLTFDIDWAHDSIIEDTVQIVESFDLRATWFFTHPSAWIQRLRSNGHEVGIHPNFNPLLLASGSSSLVTTINDCLDWSGIVTSTRSHSLVFGTPIANQLFKSGVRFSSNYCIPASTDIVVCPFKTSTGLTECAYSWADEFAWHDVQQPSILQWSKMNGLLVADFHPIHVFLNSSDSQAYEETRTIHQAPSELVKHRSEGNGARRSLIELCEQLR